MTIYIAVLTVGGEFAQARAYSTREAAAEAAIIMAKNASSEGYTNEFGDYYIEPEDYDEYVVESELDEPVVLSDIDEEAV